MEQFLTNRYDGDVWQPCLFTGLKNVRYFVENLNEEEIRIAKKKFFMRTHMILSTESILKQFLEYYEMQNKTPTDEWIDEHGISICVVVFASCSCHIRRHHYRLWLRASDILY